MFAEGQEAVQVIARWSKSPEFMVYIQSLEDYDEIIGENW